MYLNLRKRALLPAIGALVLVGMLATAQIANAVFVRPKAASPFQTSLVIAHDECVPGSAFENSIHNPANLAGVSCEPERKSSTRITHGDPAINGQVANFQGNVKLVVSLCPGASCDVLFPSASVTPATGLVGAGSGNNYLQDVRCGPLNGACVPGSAVGWTGAGTGDDYAGILVASSSIRITDNNNETTTGSGVYTDTGTVQNITFSVPMKCTPTAATGAGGFCTPLAFDAAVGGPPGGVTGANSICACVASGKRSNIENGQIGVIDGGADGNPSTTPADNRPVARQGIFIP
jgi:hypothetical protein